MTTTPAALAPQAWDDQRIYTALYDISSRHPEDNAPILYGSEAESVCRQIRDDLNVTIATQAAHIAQLERNVASWKTGYMQKDLEAIEERERWIKADERIAVQVAELVEKQKYILELEQEQTALWHSLNTMSEYVETLEAQLAAAATWEPVPDGELLPCPFCGGRVEIREIEGVCFASCDECGAGSGGSVNRHHVIESWNRRVATPTWDPVEDGFHVECKNANENESSWHLYASEGDIGVVNWDNRAQEYYVYAASRNLALCRRVTHPSTQAKGIDDGN